MFPTKRMKVQVEHEIYDLDIVLVDDHEPGKILGHPKSHDCHGSYDSTHSCRPDRSAD